MQSYFQVINEADRTCLKVIKGKRKDVRKERV